MKRIFALLLTTLIWSQAVPVSAQETTENELELVRQLRQKGWNDLAKTKIEELLKRGDPILNATLPLELARLNISIARQQDPEQRFALFTAARSQLQDYINKNKGKAAAALASAELARVTSYHAQALLSKAMREEDNRSRHERARPAEVMFIQAGKDLDAAIAAIEAAIQDPANAKEKKLLQDELQQARFDSAINIFDQARTYIDKAAGDVNIRRSEIVDKARKAFFALRSDESSEVGWLANAWLMKCAMELTTPDDVILYHKKIMDRKDDKLYQPSIQPAVRLVRYFYIQDLTMPRSDDTETIGNNSIASKTKKKMQPIDRLREVQKEGDAWLKAYPKYTRTYEGQGVLYELAYAHMAEAFMIKDEKAAGAEFDKAIKHFDELSSMESDLAERARQLSMSIKFKRLDSKAELKTFDEFYMKAMLERRSVIELAQKLEEPKADRKKLEDERKKHLKEVITSLNKALALASSRTPVQKVDDARYYLCGAYLAHGDPYRAAIVAESIGRHQPPTRRSPEGAATALATYSALQNRDPDDVVLRKRLQDLAAFVLTPENQRLWSADPVTGMARYQLAMAAKREDNAILAILHLEQMPPTANDYIYTQGQLLFIAEDARQKAGDDEYLVQTKDGKSIVGSLINKTKSEITIREGDAKPQTFKLAEVKSAERLQDWYRNSAKSALARMPKLNPKSEESSVIAMYFYAKIEMSKFMYADAMKEVNAKEELKAIKACNDMAQYVKVLISEFDQVPMHIGSDDSVPNGRVSKKNHEQIGFTMQVMLKYADLGIAETRFRSDAKDRFDLVLKATDGVVNAVLAQAKKAPPTEPIRMKDYRVTGDILGLALRANVQKGNVDKGKAILDVLKRLAGTEKDQVASGNVVAMLLNDIAGQIRRMKSENDPALKDTKGHYTAFLDEISKEYAAKGFDNTAAIMIAHAYSSLEMPQKAADIFSKVKPGVDVEKKIEKKKNENDAELKARQTWEEENNRYWGVQIEYVRALRACKDEESTDKAMKIAETVIKHPNASYKVQAMMEKNLMLEDQQKYREAYVLWQAFMKTPGLANNLSNKDVQKVYFTGYFYAARTLYKTATLDPAIKDRPKLVTAAATMIVKLEYAKTKEGWLIAEPLFKEYFLDKEADQLKKEYDRLKAVQEKLLKTGSMNPADRNSAMRVAVIDIADRLRRMERDLAARDEEGAVTVEIVAEPLRCTAIRYR